MDLGKLLATEHGEVTGIVTGRHRLFYAFVPGM